MESPIPIDSLLWHATRYSDVLQLDRRVVAKALEAIPAQTRNGVRVWHVREGMRAIFGKDKQEMTPREQLDYYRAQREKLKLGEEIGKVIPAAEVERIASEAFKSLALVLSTLPDALERGCTLSPDAVARAQTIIDDARESLYAALVGAMHG